jgi:DNA-binding transcriptional regulator LsrR (DeoR family)
MERETPHYLGAITVSDIAMRLNARLKDRGQALKSVHVIPSELTQNAGWSLDDQQQVDQDSLNRRLGELAMNFVVRELSNTLAVNQFRYEPKTGQCTRAERPFRIGLATGSTIFRLVESMKQLRAPHNVEISPLVIGPVPETKYSAGFIADMFADKFESDNSRLVAIAEPFYSPKSQNFIALKLRKEFVDRRDDKIPEPGAKMAEYFDWVLTGIGARNAGQNEVHMKKIYGKAPDGMIGDICSRLFDIAGRELAEPSKISDAFVAISFSALESMCKIDGAGKRVIAIAGGKLKYPAILTLLQREKPLFNVLVTDELTARRLLVDVK